MADLKAAAERRILELESELAVRDNMGNEVLRILREVTGKRDFHSEMEAAEWAARMILDLQTQLFLEQQSSKEAMSREAAAVSREIGARAELAEARLDSARLDYVLSHTENDSVIGDVSAEGFWDDMEAEHIGDEREHLRAWRRAIDSTLEGKSDDKG